MRAVGKKSKKDKTAIKKELSRTFEIPEEVVLDIPLISFKGREEAVIENYRGIIEYSTEKMRINTASGVLKVTGDDLIIKCLDADNIVIAGKINSAEFL